MHFAKLFRVVAVGSLLSLACQNAPDAPTALDSLALRPANNGATVVNVDGGSCGMVGANADENLVFGGTGEVNRKLENENWVQLDCKHDDVVNLSGRGQSFRGFLCTIFLPGGGSVVTFDSHATVSASGRGTLSCRYEK